MKRNTIVVLVILVAVAALAVLLIANGVIVLDYSAVAHGANIYWNDTLYVECSGQYHEGRTVARTPDGWDINEVVGDESHTFVVKRNFLDQYLMVREDYAIPSSGEVTVVSYGWSDFKDEELCSTIFKILECAAAEFEYETEEIYIRTENQNMKKLYVGYNGCPIATEFKGYLGKVNGEWCLTTENLPWIESSGSPVPSQTVLCYTMPEEFHAVLEAHFG